MRRETVSTAFYSERLGMEWYTHVSSKRVLTKHEPCHVEKHIESSKKESKHEEAGVVW